METGTLQLLIICYRLEIKEYIIIVDPSLLYQTLFPLASLVLATMSYMHGVGGGREGRSQAEEVLDQARVALGQHLQDFAMKFGI